MGSLSFGVGEKNGGGDTATKVIGRDTNLFSCFSCYSYGLCLPSGAKVNLQIWKGNQAFHTNAASGFFLPNWLIVKKIMQREREYHLLFAGMLLGLSSPSSVYDFQLFS